MIRNRTIRIQVPRAIAANSVRLALLKKQLATGDTQGALRHLSVAGSTEHRAPASAPKRATLDARSQPGANRVLRVISLLARTDPAFGKLDYAEQCHAAAQLLHSGEAVG